MGYPGVLILHGIRTVLVLVLITHSGAISVRAPAIWGIFLIQVLFTLRGSFREGSDTISHIAWAALALAHILPNDPDVTEASLWCIVLQGCLSYAGNGRAKWKMPEWRSGQALTFITRHSIWGSAALFRELKRHPELARLMTWGTLLMETTFPLVLLLGYPWCWLFLGWGVMLHLISALFMGLTEFPLSFVSTYPAIVFAVLRAETILST